MNVPRPALTLNTRRSWEPALVHEPDLRAWANPRSSRHQQPGDAVRCNGAGRADYKGGGDVDQLGHHRALFGPRQGLKVGVANLPAATAPVGRISHQRLLYLANTDKAQACWEWARLPGQQQRRRSGCGRRSLASRKRSQQVGDDRRRLLACVADGRALLLRMLLSKEDGWAPAFLADPGLWQVLDKKSGVEEALNEAQRLAGPVPACMVAAATMAKTYEGCLKQTDPACLAFLLARASNSRLSGYWLQRMVGNERVWPHE